MKTCSTCVSCKENYSYDYTGGKRRVSCHKCRSVLLKLTGRDRTREIVRMRDDHTCQHCKAVWVRSKRRFDVHHLNELCGIKTYDYDRVSEIDGLITLCHKCHISACVDREKLGPKKLSDLDRKVRNKKIRMLRFKRKVDTRTLADRFYLSHTLINRILTQVEE